METVGEALSGLSAWWAALPAVPDLGLPPPTDPVLLIAIATVVTALGVMGLLTGWVEKRLSYISLMATTFGLTLFFWVWEADRDGFGWIAVPEAFVELVARILR